MDSRGDVDYRLADIQRFRGQDVTMEQDHWLARRAKELDFTSTSHNHANPKS